MKHVLQPLRFYLFMTVLLGGVYPLLMTGLSQILFPAQANGGLIREAERVVGAKLIGQNFEKPEYFWGRPSANKADPLSSGGSNLSLTSGDLKKLVEQRADRLKHANPEAAGLPPQDLLYASASGLDPHISPEAAYYQAERVAKAYGVSLKFVREKILEASDEREFRIFGEPTVNVLTLNRSLDESRK